MNIYLSISVYSNLSIYNSWPLAIEDTRLHNPDVEMYYRRRRRKHQWTETSVDALSAKTRPSIRDI